MLQNMAEKLAEESAEWVAEDDTFGIDRSEGFRLLPAFGKAERPLQRRAVLRLLEAMLGPDARVEAASVEAVLAGFANGAPNSGYVTNIQYDLAVSANKRGVLVDPWPISEQEGRSMTERTDELANEVAAKVVADELKQAVEEEAEAEAATAPTFEVISRLQQPAPPASFWMRPA